MKIRKPTVADRQRIYEIIAATGVFRDNELPVAEEVLDSALNRPDTDYHALCIEDRGVVAGYICYGEVPLTLGCWDLYWIAVDPTMQGKGAGRMLVREMERRIISMAGRKVYVDTSSLPSYGPARRLYENCGYHVAAVLPDFFRPGDDKVMYARDLDLPA